MFYRVQELWSGPRRLDKPKLTVNCFFIGIGVGFLFIFSTVIIMILLGNMSSDGFNKHSYITDAGFTVNI